MNKYLQRANELKEDIINSRRIVHQFAEVGFDLPQTVEYVMQKLTEFGITPTLVGKSGVTGLIGNGNGKTILIRADMDALPMQEQSGLDFCATNGNCHSCGHDNHVAMLLYAAKMLKENESNINGYVKLMFQPAEELLSGAVDMIENGILENPKVHSAFALHVNIADEHSTLGDITFFKGEALFSGDALRIKVTGMEAHGSVPELGVDAITISAHIVLALQEIIAREISNFDKAIVLVGKITSGSTCNTMSGYAEMEVSVRATTEEKRQHLIKRVTEISQSVAMTYRGTAEVEHMYGIYPLFADEELADTLSELGGEVVGQDKIHIQGLRGGTEDFAALSTKIPTSVAFIGADGTYGAHHPKMVINEDVLPLGSATYAHIAEGFLNK